MGYGVYRQFALDDAARIYELCQSAYPRATDEPARTRAGAQRSRTRRARPPPRVMLLKSIMLGVGRSFYCRDSRLTTHVLARERMRAGSSVRASRLGPQCRQPELV